MNNKKLLFTILLTGAFCTPVLAQNTLIFPKGKIGKNTDNYTGTIWLNELSKPDSIFKFGVAQAVYASGSKLDWHVHPGGQILLITDGTGYYQEKGKPVQIVHKGDVIKCAPGVEHWHTAAPNSEFAYVAISPSEKGKPARIVHKGDVIKCTPGVAHTHMAAPNSSFAYIGIESRGIKWLQRVTNEEYKSVK